MTKRLNQPLPHCRLGEGTAAYVAYQAGAAPAQGPPAAIAFHDDPQDATWIRPAVQPGGGGSSVAP